MRLSVTCWLVGLVLAVAVVVCCHGCTVHFKGKEVELDAHANATFELEKVDLFRDTAGR